MSMPKLCLGVVGAAALPVVTAAQGTSRSTTRRSPSLFEGRASRGPGASSWLRRRASSRSIRVIAGEVALLTGDTVTFRLNGQPGERVVFPFKTGR
ncbi:MAG TPA: hypothetical protein VKA01_00315 [Vicinamibacteria bacterium]|nr:hypothetical protein [Vicinamibacteria bacterium]